MLCARECKPMGYATEGSQAAEIQNEVALARAEEKSQMHGMEQYDARKPDH